MKRFLSVIMASVVLFFSQCKPEPVDENNGDNGKRVKVSCTIDINGGCKSDFTNLMDNGSVNWSNGLERVYVAIPGAEPRIIELISQSDGNHPKLEFEGEAAEGLITDGTEYDIWYFGHSKQLDIPYYSNDGSVLTGSIAEQSGRLSDLGYNHIAKTTVTSETVEGNVVLNLNGTLRNQIAIALLDLENVTELYGDAIKGTEYKLQYNADTEKYELAVTEDSDAAISVESAEGISYVVLFPNDTDESKIKCVRNAKTYAYSFYNGVKANKIYFKMNSDGVTPEALAWVEIEEEPETPDSPTINGHEYVDLGLPSGLKWATCNVGASSPEDYGNYYAWGETETKAEYTEDNSVTIGQQLNDISGNAQYDAAAANWGGSWRMPTKAELEELIDECTWTWTTQNGVKGYKVTGPNGNHIFLPAAGFRYWSSLYEAGEEGYYCSSSPNESHSDYAYNLLINSGTQGVDWNYRDYGQSVRPVSE